MMTTETRKIVIRHLKGVISALEKEKEDDDDRIATMIENVLDGKWSHGKEHRMHLRTSDCVESGEKVAIKRGLMFKIE